MGDAGLPPGPAQGLTPPLHQRKGFHPLTRFRWRVHWGVRESAVSIAGCPASRPETRASLGDAGLPPGPAQGLTPPLHPRKGFHPLTRFRWRVHLELRVRSRTTSLAMSNPMEEGTKAVLPGISRRMVHLRAVPGGQTQ